MANKKRISVSVPALVLDATFPLIRFHPFPRLIERVSNVSSDSELGKTNLQQIKR
jgi:hypothetical protein